LASPTEPVGHKLGLLLPFTGLAAA
jgi:hypothetical protein